MTVKQRFELRQEIQTRFAAAIEKETGAIIEVTNTGADEWTISGQPDQAAKAVAWLTETDLMSVNEEIYDEELEETFVYMTAN